MKTSIFLLLTCIALSSIAQKTKNKSVTIEPNLSYQKYEHFNRLTLNSSNSHVEFLEGFDFAWGYTYEISVKETKLSETLSDGTQYDYSFIKIISKTKVADSIEFRLFLDANRYSYKMDSSEQEMNITLKKINDSTYNYFDEVEIIVPDHLSAKFNQIFEGKTSKVGRFVFFDDKQIRLIAL
ncbi:MAG: hypothetical protein ACI8Q1_001106 [Parvicella sp.]|jgi:hypothetical protein